MAVAGLALAAGVVPGPARADQAAASACAKTLPPEAMIIYQDAAPHVAPGTTMRSLLQSRVKALVLAGRVQRGTARRSAQTAYGCLKKID